MYNFHLHSGWKRALDTFSTRSCLLDSGVMTRVMAQHSASFSRSRKCPVHVWVIALQLPSHSLATILDL
eukprot:2037306-Amphidinium_carterae.1